MPQAGRSRGPSDEPPDNSVTRHDTDIRAFANVELGPGTLYGAITRLEERGFIRPVGSADRRQPYRLTAAGKRYLEEQLAELESVVRVGLRRLRQA